MYPAVMVGKFVKRVVREWCPSTTGPLLPTMTDSLLPLAGRCYTSGTTSSFRAKNKKGPKPLEHVQLIRMKRDHNKGFYSQKC